MITVKNIKQYLTHSGNREELGPPIGNTYYLAFQFLMSLEFCRIIVLKYSVGKDCPTYKNAMAV